MSKKQNRKSWRPEDEDMLVEVWADKIGQLRGMRKNSHVYQEMTVIMKGYTPEEINIKIHKLTNRYNKEKKIIGPSGGSPSEWKFYTRIHSILGGLPIHNIANLVEESATVPQFSQTDVVEETDEFEDDIEEILLSATELSEPSTSAGVSNSKPAAKKRKVSKIVKEANKLDEIIVENLKVIQKNDEQMIEIEKKRNAILERIAETCDQVQKELVVLLKQK